MYIYNIYVCIVYTYIRKSDTAQTVFFGLIYEYAAPLQSTLSYRNRRISHIHHNYIRVYTTVTGLLIQVAATSSKFTMNIIQFSIYFLIAINLHKTFQKYSIQYTLVYAVTEQNSTCSLYLNAYSAQFIRKMMIFQ